MKKRVFASLLALALMLTLLPAPARALGAFADVTDTETARNVEVLRLLGVIEGDGYGNFRPYSCLTRAEFCKMALVLQGRGEQAVRYRTRTFFPDVRASHWAAGYVNMASAAGDETYPQLVHGFPDGTFRPDQEISYGEAVTVLVRMLGYDDKASGVIWPQGYLDLGAASGLTAGLTLAGDATITRAQAAKLFVGALAAKTKSGGTIKPLGTELVTLLGIDLAKGAMRTTDGKSAPAEVKMAKPMASTVLNGLKGYIVYDSDGKRALTFLPVSSASGAGTIVADTMGDAAVIVQADGSTASFNALTGNAKGYTIWRNGVQIEAKELKRSDVASYNAESNAVIVCDTRVLVYYESCLPTPSEPTSIKALGGTTFMVLPTAQRSVAEFHPGEEMVLLLTADGRIAGAAESGVAATRPNALGYVDADGTVQMFCGGGLLATACADASKAGQIVSITERKRSTGSGGEVSLSVKTKDADGALDIIAGTLGGKKLAPGALVLKDGVLTTVSMLEETYFSSRQIVYSRVNASGTVDLIVLGDTSTEQIGRVVRVDVHEESFATTDGSSTVTVQDITIDCGKNGTVGPARFNTVSISEGSFVVFATDDAGNFTMIERLTKLSNIPLSAWVGGEVLNFGGESYGVAPSVICLNRDTGTWFDTFEDAMRYGTRFNVYVLDGYVRAIEAWA